jgi:DNA-directed RNA polymerase subunit RPC12/RpoP
MMTSFPERPDIQDFEQLLRDGIAAVKAGNRTLGRSLLFQATKIQLSDARPWLWLSATTDDPDEQRNYLEYAVAADPGNAAARRGLVLLSGKVDKARLVPEGEAVAPRRPEGPEDARGEIYQCPNCGGRLSYTADQGGLVCPYCGYVQSVEDHPSTGKDEQPIDFVLPTITAHRWAESQKHITCERCGAVSLLPPDQKSDQCPYCGSNRLIESAEAVDLVDPHSIALMKVEEQAAIRQVKSWLGKGLFAPDDLTARVGRLQLRPAYYPFWSFDGTVELPWNCEVNEGTSRSPHWVRRSGSEFEFFDDVLVPGLRALEQKEIAQIEPYNLKELVQFKPEYLVGWQALSYDIPLSDASLTAREKVIERLKRTLYARIEPGEEKRAIRYGAGQWSGVTFRHVLLPLWVGMYRYRGVDYRLLINGQTGKVGGVKPKDAVKVILIMLIVGLVLLVLGWLLFSWWRSGGGLFTR